MLIIYSRWKISSSFNALWSQRPKFTVVIYSSVTALHPQCQCLLLMMMDDGVHAEQPGRVSDRRRQAGDSPGVKCRLKLCAICRRAQTTGINHKPAFDELTADPMSSRPTWSPPPRSSSLSSVTLCLCGVNDACCWILDFRCIHLRTFTF